MDWAYQLEMFRLKALRVVLIGMAIIGLVGCGVKRSPKPLGLPDPPVVSDLTFSMTDGSVQLKWRTPKAGDRIMNLAQGFFVYRSQARLTDGKCDGCPMLFKRVADIALSDTGEDGSLSYVEALMPGYRYVYKVALSLQNGVIGGDSNFVEFDYQ